MRWPVLALLVFLSGPALAGDPAEGLWRTEPDRKNLVSHIAIRRCGAALCGRVLHAFDSAGREVVTPHVGRELFWDLRPEGGGRYGGGTVRVPLLNVVAEARMVLVGDRLEVTGCKGPVCDGQVWRRVK